MDGSTLEKMDLIRFFSKNEAQFYAVLRILAGFLFLWHGSQKLFNFPPSALEGDRFSTQTLLTGVLELVGGLFIMLGLLTRWAALFCSMVMIVAYFSVHAPKAFLPLVNHGESASFYFFLFLYFLIRGSGVWSIDHLVKGPVTVHESNSEDAV